MPARRPDGPRGRTAFLGSVALHALAIAALGFGSLGAEPARRVKVYRVDIVSPPPNVRGEPPAQELAAAEPGPAAQPAATPAAQPPAPRPDPPAPEPAKQPEPPREQPKAAERPAPRETPRRPEPPREQPKAAERETPRRTEQPKSAEPRRTTEPRPTAQPGGQRTGTGSGPDRTTGSGTRTGPATGRNPDANSAGGEGLNVRTRGVACPENYCNNVVRQVRRFFRAPEGTQGASGNVCFTLFRDGSVDEVAVERQRGGGFQFRLALVEAVEQAGLQHAFGALPRGFEAESIQLCVLMSPATT